ncbi:sugar ABC transporter substrate-binding protein [Umezawaea sp. NPDC059074]|uniref:sugar ABC transporter substrate-binding protein n=1 Tax=Umezawaea sp. NPDC059074 TaxID=3346716 RepID=UPI0036B83C34
MSKFTVWRSLAAVGALALVAACGAAPAAQPGRPQVVFAQASGGIGFSAAVTASVQKAAQEKGWDLTVLDNKADATTAVEHARTTAVRKPALFIEYNLHPESNKQISKIMADAHVPVLSVQFPTDGAPLYAIDNTKVGTLGGEGLAKAATERFGPAAVTKALILNFPEGGAANLARGAGAEAALKKAFPSIEIVQGADKNDTAVATQVVNSFLVSNPDRKLLIWSHLDQYSIAAVNAARAAGREQDVLIASTGGEASILPEIRKAGGAVVGTASLFPDSWGGEIVALGGKVLGGEKVPDLSEPSKVRFVDPSNVDELYPS